MDTKEKNEEKIFREEMRALIVDWYSACPQSMKFVSNTIQSYKRTFPDDDFMKEVGHDL